MPADLVEERVGLDVVLVAERVEQLTGAARVRDATSQRQDVRLLVGSESLKHEGVR